MFHVNADLSSASIDRVIFDHSASQFFFFSTRSLIDVFVSFIVVLEVDEFACVIGFAGHSILAFSIVIPISVIVSFRSCTTSDSDVSLWNPVITALH